MEQPQVGVENTQLSSSLLAPLFSQITDDKRLNILDMGMATSATVSFLVKLNAAYNFAGLLTQI